MNIHEIIKANRQTCDELMNKGREFNDECKQHIIDILLQMRDNKVAFYDTNYQSFAFLRLNESFINIAPISAIFYNGKTQKLSVSLGYQNRFKPSHTFEAGSKRLMVNWTELYLCLIENLSRSYVSNDTDIDSTYSSTMPTKWHVSETEKISNQECYVTLTNGDKSVYLAVVDSQAYLYCGVLDLTTYRQAYLTSFAYHKDNIDKLIKYLDDFNFRDRMWRVKLANYFFVHKIQ